MGETIEEEYISPLVRSNFKLNYSCVLTNSGRWRLEDKLTFGKWILLVRKKDDCPPAPTFGDQRNFFSGLLEAEYRNDQYVFEDGSTRPSCFKKKLEMFKQLLEEFEQRLGIVDTPKNLMYYMNQK